jgi:Holliday junction resolvasome RuvABC endonuclease subunit
MNYNQQGTKSYQGESYPSNEVERVNPMFEQLSIGLTNCNNSAHSTLTAIEEKVHRMLDRRYPEQKGVEEGSIKAQLQEDLYTKLYVQVNSTQHIAERLDKLLKHLSEIV